MPTYEEVSRTQLRALSAAVGQSNASTRYIDLQRSLMAPWNAREIGDKAPYPSGIGDDHSPYEYSVAYTPRGAELRILFEAQAAEPSLFHNHEEALRVNARIKAQWGVSLSRFEQIADLFAIEDQAPANGFSLWHAACLSPHGAPDFKIYLNPQLHGREAAQEVIHEVFHRLGFTDAKDSLERLRFRGHQLDELKYISLDLSEEPRARLKVYVCHHEARPLELEQAFQVAPSHQAGDAAQFCSTMAPQAASFAAKSVSSCLAFIGGNPVPHTVTMHLPIAHYAESDAVASRRISAFMARHSMDQLVHKRVLQAMTRIPLRHSVGMQSYASYRRHGADVRLTVYLSPELFRNTIHSDHEWDPAISAGHA
jgi:hypothetical protein